MNSASSVNLSRTEDASVVVHLAGVWQMKGGLPSSSDVVRELDMPPGPTTIRFDSSGLSGWDSSILTFLLPVLDHCRSRDIATERVGLPEGVQRLLALAEAVPEKTDAKSQETKLPFIEHIGRLTLSAQLSLGEAVGFFGEFLFALGRFFRGKARYRRTDLGLLIQQAGAEALSIVTLVSFLLGLILAFVGATQLRTFGATIYVANLVGIAMVRDMAALMTAIVMAGRSGAAYAAQLSSMKVTQEIDALSTMAVPPMEFLVLPRVLALVIMMPLLTLYADFVGILGGLAVGVSMLDLSFTTYLQQTFNAVGIDALIGGVFKSCVYGSLIALAGCLRGMQASRSSAGVGEAATSAVVTGVVAIIVACGAFQFIFYVLGW